MRNSTQCVVVSAVVLMLLVAVCGMITVEAADTSSEERPQINILACRIANYYKFQDDAMAHIASAGFKYVFMNIIPPDQVEATKKQLAEHGLSVAVFRGDTELSRESCVDELAEQLQTCKKMGVKFMFLSPKHKKVSKQVAYQRLRRIGDIAKKYGVTIGLETHPDLGTNADVHLETMKAIDHPNIRVNFDTANITYYNKNADAVTELKKIIKYVGTVEVKDHNGQYETWHFPALGKGIVDIPEVLRILKKHGYTGPITLEVEGVKGIERNESEVKKDVADSAAYIRSLGTFK